MKNAKQMLVIASITAGMSLSNKIVYAQQASVNNIKDQSIYNYNLSSKKCVKLGDRGTVIKNIQTALNSYFGKKLLADGIFGPQTKKAVMEVQKKLALKEDGIFGPQTAEALLKYSYNFSVDDKNGFSPANEKIHQLSIETENFSSNTNYYILVNSSDHTCKIYKKTNNLWKQIDSFDIFSGIIDKGVYSLGLNGSNLNFNGIPMNDFTQINGLNVFYSAKSDSGYGLRVSNENAKFISKLPKKTAIQII
ncbi:peptidoglycan-binding domain-containing protein [Clostridium thailandense]|uniref:peptidoglycan-binding domain-containing protein n=1 Tax=Clostridium thailandense TaxID=2794346 RepID=UPI0039896C34